MTASATRSRRRTASSAPTRRCFPRSPQRPPSRSGEAGDESGRDPFALRIVTVAPAARDTAACGDDPPVAKDDNGSARSGGAVPDRDVRRLSRRSGRRRGSEHRRGELATTTSLDVSRPAGRVRIAHRAKLGIGDHTQRAVDQTFSAGIDAQRIAVPQHHVRLLPLSGCRCGRDAERLAGLSDSHCRPVVGDRDPRTATGACALRLPGSGAGCRSRRRNGSSRTRPLLDQREFSPMPS